MKTKKEKCNHTFRIIKEYDNGNLEQCKDCLKVRSINQYEH